MRRTETLRMYGNNMLIKLKQIRLHHRHNQSSFLLLFKQPPFFSFYSGCCQAILIILMATWERQSLFNWQLQFQKRIFSTEEEQSLNAICIIICTLILLSIIHYIQISRRSIAVIKMTQMSWHFFPFIRLHNWNEISRYCQPNDLIRHLLIVVGRCLNDRCNVRPIVVCHQPCDVRRIKIDVCRSTVAKAIRQYNLIQLKLISVRCVAIFLHYTNWNSQ